MSVLLSRKKQRLQNIQLRSFSITNKPSDENIENAET